MWTFFELCMQTNDFNDGRIQSTHAQGILSNNGIDDRNNWSVLFNHQTYTPSIVVFDLADPHCVDRAAEEILKCYGHVDVLINNAGISYRGDILGTHISVQRDVMETNYFGPVALTQGQSWADPGCGAFNEGVHLQRNILRMDKQWICLFIVDESLLSGYVSDALSIQIKGNGITINHRFLKTFSDFREAYNILHLPGGASSFNSSFLPSQLSCPPWLIGAVAMLLWLVVSRAR